MIYREEDLLEQTALEAARAMLAAARTAPKSRGRNNLAMTIVSRDDLPKIAKKMRELGEISGQHFFARDAGNVEASLAMLLIACKIAPADLNYCGLCGFTNCADKQEHSETPCTFNSIDLGIAIGSAVSVACDRRMDNRILYTAGMAVRDLEYFSSEYKIVMAIPLSISSKNIFFDRG